MPEKGLIEKVIEAGRHAPSVGNNQTTHMIVITDGEMLREPAVPVREEFAKMEITEGRINMKKVAVLWSSPNQDGLTASAKNQLIRGVEEAGAQIQEIHLNQKKLEHCRACGNGWGTCRQKGECVIHDDFAGIYRTLREADGIIWVSAVYWSDMTECFKAFFDRLRRCEAAYNHFLQDKRCLLVACAGGTGRGTLECLTQLERGLTHMGMRAYDRIPVVRYNRDYMLPALAEAGKTYVARLENGFDMYY